MTAFQTKEIAFFRIAEQQISRIPFRQTKIQPGGGEFPTARLDSF